MVQAQQKIAKENNCVFINDSVLDIEKDQNDNSFILTLSKDNDEKIRAEKVIVATGAYCNFPPILQVTIITKLSDNLN